LNRSSVRRLRWPALVLSLAVAPACELTEVTTARGEDILIVEAVLRAGAAQQIVLLHRTVQVLEGELGAEPAVAGEPGASVSVRAVGSEPVVLSQAPVEFCTEGLEAPDYIVNNFRFGVTCFISPRLPGWINSGSTYELDVVTRGGLRVRGRTTVPGAFTLQSPPVGSWVCSLPPNTNLPIAWSVASGAWSYIATMQIVGLDTALEGTGVEAPERIQLTGVAVSERDTTLRVPADFGLFELTGGNQEVLKLLQNGFPSGVTAFVSIAAADRNYVNGVRGGAFNPSGNVRISSVVGDGLGVFGSIVPRTLQIHVGTGPPSMRPCLG
jgi:hypothetical protein